jgi:hypothetical protein
LLFWPAAAKQAEPLPCGCQRGRRGFWSATGHMMQEADPEVVIGHCPQARPS